MSAPSGSARGLPLCRAGDRSRGRGVGLGRVHSRARAPRPELPAARSPCLSSSVSAAAEPSCHLPRCLPLGPALPRLCSRPVPAAPCLFVSAALFPVCLSAVWAGVSELLLLLLLLRCGPELSFNRLACPELVTHRTLEGVVLIKKV